ncbi:hypothetical protein CBW42_04305 [Butyricicoccus porcorum]|uniref:Uncharacterized protein n=1 Tax=Butyricicoccus porcorum TaxID=1945634 RepID=A0A252F4X4_9FIRM|nr:hypothetical protein CBW42_04305 [Butyricicoccus porcorum]
MVEIERVKKSKPPLAVLKLRKKSWLWDRGNQYIGFKTNNVGLDFTREKLAAESDRSNRKNRRL